MTEFNYRLNPLVIKHYNLFQERNTEADLLKINKFNPFYNPFKNISSKLSNVKKK